MDPLERYNSGINTIIPRETVFPCCFVTTPKQMFMSLMAGERVCFKGYNEAARYYLRTAEIFRSLYAPGMSDYGFVLALNNYIVRNIRYDYDVLTKETLTPEDMESFEIDAPLFKGKGVCSAKSKFFSLLCSLANIRTVLVTGSLKDCTDDSRHAWNKVFLQKPGDSAPKWWNIDVTNNRVHRRFDLGYGDYFLVTDREIMRTHFFIEYDETFEYRQINRLVTGSFDYPAA